MSLGAETTGIREYAPSAPCDAAAGGRPPAGLSTEALTLIAAGLIDVDAAKERLAPLLRQGLDWNLLIEIAHGNRMLPQLFLALERTGWELAPAAAAERLRALFKMNARNNLLLLHELMALGRVFEASGIEAISYKGPMLATAVYSNLSHRQIWDLDLLFRPEHIEIARRLVLERGYLPEAAPSGAGYDEIRRRDCELNFDHARSGIHIELHWKVIPDRHARHFENDRLWRESTPIAGAQARGLRALTPHLHFLVLCLHGGEKHQWSRMRWILDIARFIEAYPDLDWSAVASDAARMQLERSVCSGVYLARALFAAPVPAGLAPLLERNRFVAGLAGLVRGRLFRSDMGLPGFEEWLSYIEAHEPSLPAGGQPRSRALQRLRYFRAALTPEWHDRNWLPAMLPSVGFLVYPLRVLRLFSRHRSNLVKRTT